MAQDLILQGLRPEEGLRGRAFSPEEEAKSTDSGRPLPLPPARAEQMIALTLFLISCSEDRAETKAQILLIPQSLCFGKKNLKEIFIYLFFTCVFVCV